MSLIDDRGRLFGRVNVIDAALAVVFLGLIPLTYGAFLLFRTPIPKITAVAPTQVVAHEGGSLQITGEDLRPFLTAQIGTVESKGFLVQTPTRAEVKLPDLAPGTYDLSLADETRTLVTVPGAVVVVPPPTLGPGAEVQLFGAFTGLSEASARAMGQGWQVAKQADGTSIAEVLAVRPPEPASQRVKVAANAFLPVANPGEFRVPAIVKIRCTMVDPDGEPLQPARCKFGNILLEQNAKVTLASATAPKQATFVVEEVRPWDARVMFPAARSAVATVRVRFVASPEVPEVMKAGDIDVIGGGVIAEAERAVLLQLGERQATTALATTEGVLRRNALQLQQPAVVVTGTLRVPLLYSAAGWTYKDRPVKAGAAFVFESAAGAMSGWVIDVKVVSQK